MDRLEIVASGRSDVGLIRENNEDAFHLGRRLAVVADGVGGSVAGELASAIVTETFAHADEACNDDDPERILGGLIARSNEAIAERIRAEPDLAGMGTTVTAAMWGPDRMTIAQVGDSRGYVMRYGRAALEQITRDDTYVQCLVEEGTLTREQAAIHPRRNVIVQAVDGSEIAPTFTSGPLRVGDRYLLCSDGLSDYVPHRDIAAAVHAATGAAAAADALVDLALNAGGPDNVTAVVLDVVARGHRPAGAPVDDP